MSYKVYFSDPTKFSNYLIIEDNEIDSRQTSLSFIGKTAAGYAQAISTNFLHLLENHASGEPPNNPIEGQLWFDTSDVTNKKLKINDSTAGGANWKPINGLYQQDESPAGASVGDVWVDTARAQMFLTVDGSNWTLVGPNYSSTLKTGSYPEQVKDIFGNTRNIIKNYIDDEVVEIISAESFTPQQKIIGFDNIGAGLNLTLENSARLNGTAYAAQNIQVTSPNRAIVGANSLVRSDIDNSITGIINFKNGLTVGIDPTFRMIKDGIYDNMLVNSVVGGRFRFRTLNSSGLFDDVLVVSGDNRRVGINTLNPTADLDVNGSGRFVGILTISSTLTNALTVEGSSIVKKSLTVYSTSTFGSTSTFESLIRIGTSTDLSLINPKEVIRPLAHRKYTIGTTSSAFAEIHSASFVGNLQGTSTFAARLVSSPLITIVGDVTSPGINFNGDGSTSTFSTVLNAGAINNKPSMTSVSANDKILVAVGPQNYDKVRALGGSGNNADFNVYRGDGFYRVEYVAGVNNSGTAYIVNDNIRIPGTLLGGQTPTNDIAIQVTGVNSLGNIVNWTTSSGTAISGLNQATKQTLLSDVTDSLVPAGAMLPYAGLTPPTGWLLCDGSIISNGDYPRLFSAIGYTYGKSLVAGQFKLPDLRGRMPIGFDDMSNGLFSSPGVANRVPGANKPTTLQASTGSGTVAGGNYLGEVTSTAGVGSTSTGLVTNVMNPYLAINYIIKV
jgi:microcystin-dependent protein